MYNDNHLIALLLCMIPCAYGLMACYVFVLYIVCKDQDKYKSNDVVPITESTGHNDNKNENDSDKNNQNNYVENPDENKAETDVTFRVEKSRLGTDVTLRTEFYPMVSPDVKNVLACDLSNAVLSYNNSSDRRKKIEASKLMGSTMEVANSADRNDNFENDVDGFEFMDTDGYEAKKSENNEKNKKLGQTDIQPKVIDYSSRCPLPQTVSSRRPQNSYTKEIVNELPNTEGKSIPPDNLPVDHSVQLSKIDDHIDKQSPRLVENKINHSCNIESNILSNGLEISTNQSERKTKTTTELDLKSNIEDKRNRLTQVE